MDLNLEKFETVKGLTGPYILFATKGENKAYISARVCDGPIPNPKNPETVVGAIGLMIRIRIYDKEGLGVNPMPGFATAFPLRGYYKVKQFIPVETMEKGFGAFVTKVKGGVTADIIEALKVALKKNRCKMALSAAALTTVLEMYVDEAPLVGRLKVYSAPDFTVAPATTES